MTEAERADVKALIAFYEARGWDWSDAAEFLIRKYNGSLADVIRTRIGVGYGRPRQKKDSKDTEVSG